MRNLLVFLILLMVYPALYADSKCLSQYKVEKRIETLKNTANILVQKPSSSEIKALNISVVGAREYALDLSVDKVACERSGYGCNLNRVSEYYLSISNYYSKFPNFIESDKYIFMRTHELLLDEVTKCEIR